TRQQLRDATGRLVSAHEEERERLARELHDSVGHAIVLFEFDMHALRQKIPKSIRGPIDPQFEAISARIRKTASEVRQLSHELHPSILKDLGLEEAVRQLGENLRKHQSLSV